MSLPFAPEQFRLQCPGCERLIDTSVLRPGERFLCAKCKKMMTFGPHLFEPQYQASWRTTRTAVQFILVASTIWCVTVGHDFGSATGHWVLGFGAPLVMWLVVVGCIILGGRTTQNLGVLVGVTGVMNGLALFFIERVGRHVGYPVQSWHARLRHFRLWSPALVLVGFAVLAVALVLQRRRRAL